MLLIEVSIVVDFLTIRKPFWIIWRVLKNWNRNQITFGINDGDVVSFLERALNLRNGCIVSIYDIWNCFIKQSEIWWSQSRIQRVPKPTIILITWLDTVKILNESSSSTLQHISLFVVKQFEKSRHSAFKEPLLWWRSGDQVTIFYAIRGLSLGFLSFQYKYG